MKPQDCENAWLGSGIFSLEFREIHRQVVPRSQQAPKPESPTNYLAYAVAVSIAIPAVSVPQEALRRTGV